MVLERTIIMTIKELCVKITLSREKLAEAAGVSASAIAAVKTSCINLGKKISGAVKEVRHDAAAVEARAEGRIQDTKAAAEEAKEKAAKVKAENTVSEAAEKAEEIKGAAEETKAKLEAVAAAAEKTAKTRKKSQKAPEKAKAVKKEAETAAAEETKKAEKEAPVRETAARKPADEPIQVIIQSPIGGEITPEAILAKVGEADTIYVRVDENKAYWVKGEEHGSVDLW